MNVVTGALKHELSPCETEMSTTVFVGRLENQETGIGNRNGNRNRNRSRKGKGTDI